MKMGGNPNDLANQMLQKVRDYLKQELNDVIQVEENSQDDYIVMGRIELAEGLLKQMKIWEEENVDV